MWASVVSWYPDFLFLTICSPDDWECFQNYLSCLIGDGSNWSKGAQNNSIHLPNSGDCKNLHLTDEMVHSSLRRYFGFQLVLCCKVCMTS